MECLLRLRDRHSDRGDHARGHARGGAGIQQRLAPAQRYRFLHARRVPRRHDCGTNGQLLWGNDALTFHNSENGPWISLDLAQNARSGAINRRYGCSHRHVVADGQRLELVRLLLVQIASTPAIIRSRALGTGCAGPSFVPLRAVHSRSIRKCMSIPGPSTPTSLALNKRLVFETSKNSP